MPPARMLKLTGSASITGVSQGCRAAAGARIHHVSHRALVAVSSKTVTFVGGTAPARQTRPVVADAITTGPGGLLSRKISKGLGPPVAGAGAGQAADRAATTVHPTNAHAVARDGDIFVPANTLRERLLNRISSATCWRSEVAQKVVAGGDDA